MHRSPWCRSAPCAATSPTRARTRLASACCANARFWGDLDDPDSDVSQALAGADEAAIHSLADSGNAPLTRYILSEKVAQWIPLEELAPASDTTGAPYFKVSK